jgi:hypothetical protein
VGGCDNRCNFVGQLVTGAHLPCVDPVDVEGAQPFVDQFFEFMRQRRLLDVIVAIEQIKGIGRTRCDLLADC